MGASPLVLLALKFAWRVVVVPTSDGVGAFAFAFTFTAAIAFTHSGVVVEPVVLCVDTPDRVGLYREFS